MSTENEGNEDLAVRHHGPERAHMAPGPHTVPLPESPEPEPGPVREHTHPPVTAPAPPQLGHLPGPPHPGTPPPTTGHPDSVPRHRSPSSITVVAVITVIAVIAVAVAVIDRRSGIA